MDKLRQLSPWQIILAAVGILLICLVGGYFLVTTLTSTPPPAAPSASAVPPELDSAANRKIIKKLDSFEAPQNLPLLTQPLHTPDPNSPSTVNPFQG